MSCESCCFNLFPKNSCLIPLPIHPSIYPKTSIIPVELPWSRSKWHDLELWRLSRPIWRTKSHEKTQEHTFIANSSPLKIEWLENVGRLYPVGVRPIFEEHVAACFWGRVLTPKKTTHYSMRMAPLTSCREKVLSLCIGIGHLENLPVYKPIWVLLNPSTIIHQPLRYMTSVSIHMFVSEWSTITSLAVLHQLVIFKFNFLFNHIIWNPF